MSLVLQGPSTQRPFYCLLAAKPKEPYVNCFHSVTSCELTRGVESRPIVTVAVWGRRSADDGEITRIDEQFDHIAAGDLRVAGNATSVSHRRTTQLGLNFR